MDMKGLNFDTLQLHAGQPVDETTRSRAMPIYQTTSYMFEDTQHGADLFALKREGHIYTRISNPTIAALEERLAALEDAAGVVVTASGMSAILYAIQTLAGMGDHIVSVRNIYGGTHTLFTTTLPRMGVEVSLTDESPVAVEAAIRPNTKGIFFETIGNPEMNVPDIDGLALVAKKHGIPLIADNTFTTPYLARLKEHGVHIAVHSLTKYIGGHGTSIGGAVVDYGTFDWKNGKFPEFEHPQASYHGLVYGDLGPAAFAIKTRVQQLRDTGACLSPFNAFLILLGCETLSLRMERHSQNGLAIAEYLDRHPKVAWVKYPGLPGSKYHELAKKYFPKGASGMLAFGMKAGRQASEKVINELKIFSHLANVGDAKSLIIHPASTTHAQISDAELTASGILPEAIRLSAGLEDVGDLIADLEQAFAKV